MKSRRNLGKVMALMAVLILMVHVAIGVDITIKSNTAWSAIKSGNNIIVPTSNDAIIISSNATLTVDVNNAVCASIRIGGGGNAANNGGTLIINNNSNITVNDLVSYITSNGIIKLSLNSGSTLICKGFTGFTGPAENYSLSNGTIQLTSDNTFPSIFTTINNLTISAGTTTLGANTTIGGTLNITSGSLDVKGFTANVATLAGSGTLTNSGSSTTFTIGNNNPSAFSGTISGALNLTKTGAGVLTLSGSNDYTGATTISDGTLQLGNATALGTIAGNTTVASVATLDLNGQTIAEPITLNGTGISSGGALQNSSSVNAACSGLITLASASSIIANNSGTISITNTGTITGAGFGLTLGGSGNGSIASIIGTGSGTLTKTGTGTWTLSRPNTYTGETTISEGTLQLDNAAALGTSSQTTVSSGATLDLKGITLSTARPLAVNGGTLANSTTAANYNGAISLGAASTINTTGDITLGGGISGTFLLTKTGAGTLNTGTILSEISALTISEGNLTIPAGGKVTVAGATTITPANGLTIQSDGTLTGSLITASATGNASVIRWMTPRRWHIVSSPVSGKTVGEFLTPNGNIPNNTVPGHTSERGMRGFNPSLNQWGDFYTNASTEAMTKGKGYSVRVKGNNGTKNVTFTGALNADDVPVSGLEAGKWNCVGNPYTSTLKLNSEGTTDNFLDVNASNLDMNYGGIYIWHQADDELVNENSGTYEPVTNVITLKEVQQGQAFMVKMASATTLNFTHAMQSHNTGLELKSTSGIWPTIKLTAMADSITSSTIIAFHEGMTPGLDPTYDAGLLKGGASVEVYTRLVEDNGIPFDIQALPANYESTVVPVGLDCTKGQQVTFSAELMHVPSSCQVLLEDRMNKVLTDLSVNSYTADLMGSTVSQDRFFLHTSYSTTGIDSKDGLRNLRAWAVSNQEMKISGKVSSKAIASLYDLQGRAVAVHSLQGGNLNSMPLKGLKQGVYLLRVQDDNRAQVLKVSVGK